MSSRRVLVVVGLFALVASCNKQKGDSEAPTADTAAKEAGGDAEYRNAPGADAAAELAVLEAQLSARKAELSTRGIAFADASDAGGSPSADPMSPPKDVRDVEPAEESQPKSARTEPTRNVERAPKTRTKNKKAPRRVTKAKPADADACAPICRPADAICDLAARICGLAAEHEDESRYEDACDRAEDDCESAADACEDCRG